ncbi:hypothetical protein sync_0615 [Synechococcus sp. CC9311]|nr:hypothetical protein sync_0615 [Synechococcus sp. CC9311]
MVSAVCQVPFDGEFILLDSGIRNHRLQRLSQHLLL